jgi:hypothetical protein
MRGPTTLLLETKDRELKAHFVEFSRFVRNHNDEEIEEWLKVHKDQVLIVRNLNGMVKKMTVDEVRLRKVTGSDIAEKFLILHEGQKPPAAISGDIWLTIGGVAISGLGLVCLIWNVKRRMLEI